MPWPSKKENELPESAGENSRRQSEHTKKTSKSSGQSWFSWSTSQTEESVKSRDAATARSSSVLMGRGVFVFFLVVVAVVLGWLAWFLLERSEQQLMEEQYYSMMARALDVTRSLAVSSITVVCSQCLYKLQFLFDDHLFFQIILLLSQTNKLKHGTMVMSQVVAFAAPNAAAWPFIWVDGYWKIVENVLPTSCYTGIHLAPLVLPEQAEEFEEFAYNKFREVFGNDTDMGAESHFGEGIWGTLYKQSWIYKSIL